MPHSSGGGSHGGGSHSSSSHSSHSSGGSRGGGLYGGSGGSSTPSLRLSDKPSATSNVYLYRNSRGRSRYIYSNVHISQKTAKSALFEKIFSVFFLLLFVSLVCLTFVGPVMSGVLVRQKPLQYTEEYKVGIVDNLNVVDNTGEVIEAMERFKDKTGMVPFLMTVENESWKTYYTDLENYAYEQYVKSFTDEAHWLIVYSEPAGERSGFNDWYWESISGDESYKACPDRYIDEFTEEFQDSLLRTDADVAQSYARSLDKLTNSIKPMNVAMDTGTAISLVFVTIVILIYIFFAKHLITETVRVVRVYRLSKTGGLCQVTGEAAERAIRDKMKSPEDINEVSVSCSYCGRTYLITAGDNRCPSCGAVEYSFAEMRQKEIEKQTTV